MWLWNILADSFEFLGINSTLRYLGLIGKHGKILFLGLDNAGKTTLMGMLKENRMTQNDPTFQPSAHELQLGGITFTAYDLGGHKQVRRVWKDYMFAADGIVFIVDSADRKRFPEAKREFDQLILDEQAEDIPILMLANKIDMDGAASEEFITQYFQLQAVLTHSDSTGRPLKLMMTSLKARQGYGEGFKWLAKFIS